MKQVKKSKTELETEKSIMYLLKERGEFECIKPDGTLDESFILSYLIHNEHRSAQEYNKVIRAFNKIKERDSFIKRMNSRKVSENTLKSIIIFNEAIVRPFSTKDNFQHGIYAGEIIKLPPAKSANEYDEGEGWKALIQKDSNFKIGDKVLYNFKCNIVLDDELLHMVGSFAGKILK